MPGVKPFLVAAALTLVSAAPSFAQAGSQTAPPKPQTPPAGAPKPQTPPATPPAAAQPAPKPPPVPFPQDAKYAFVDMQAVASNSASGKAASARLNALTESKQKEIDEKAKQLQAATTKRDTSVAMNDLARQQIEKEIDRLQREIQFARSNAQADVQSLNNELMSDFQQKVAPIIEAIAKEKGLYMVFTPESGFAYVHPGLNITDEVIKRLDAKK